MIAKIAKIAVIENQNATGGLELTELRKNAIGTSRLLRFWDKLNFTSQSRAKSQKRTPCPPAGSTYNHRFISHYDSGFKIQPGGAAPRATVEAP